MNTNEQPQATPGSAQKALMGASLNRTGRPTAPRLKGPRTKPVRITVDFPPDLHRRLKVWCVQNDASLADVQRVLSTRLLDDPELAMWLLERLNADA